MPPTLFQDICDTRDIVNAVQAESDMIVELKDEQLVRFLQPDPSRIKAMDCRALIVTAKGYEPYDFISRMFAPKEGIDEDPVTGSAHCKLADYWRAKLGKETFFAYQASARGGSMGVTIVGDRVHLRGQAVTVLEGMLRI